MQYTSLSITLDIASLRQLRAHLHRRAMTRSEYVRTLIRRDIAQASRLLHQTLAESAWATPPPLLRPLAARAQQYLTPNNHGRDRDHTRRPASRRQRRRQRAHRRRQPPI